MSEVAHYSAFETRRDGQRIEIRALRPDDRAALIAAVARSSAQSLYRRFFEIKRHFTEPEIEFFLNVDFVNHVALVAVVEENGRPAVIGGARYVVVAFRPSPSYRIFRQAGWCASLDGLSQRNVHRLPKVWDFSCWKTRLGACP